MLKNTYNSYGSVSKFLHWTIALLVIAMLIYGFYLENIPEEYVPLAFNIHKLTGLTILSLMVLRLIWASMNVKPVLPPETKAWERWGERTVHYSLYAFLIAMPLAGWIGSSFVGKGPHIGNTTLNLPLPQDKALSILSFDVHNTIAVILIGLITLHVLAALYHHIVRRDNILMRMMPGSDGS